MKLLVVEDEKRMIELLRKGLTEEGHTVTCATDGSSGLDIAANYNFDVIILDIMMPKLDGYEVARRLRLEKVATPVLMLTAKDSVPDIVHGLDAGADDYLTKPFSFNELLARLRAVQRRARVPQPPLLQVGDLTLAPGTRDVSRSGVKISLTRTEYSLLEQLIYHAGSVVRRQYLIEAVWGFDREIEDNTLDVFVRLLRHKIQDDVRPKLIHTEEEGSPEASPYPDSNALVESAERHSQTLYQVKALSPHHRFVIALHSPYEVAETGLRGCPPEKKAEKAHSLSSTDRFL